MNIKKLNWRDNITDIGKKSGLFEILADVKELDITYHIRNYKFYSDKASPFENLEVFTGDKYYMFSSNSTEMIECDSVEFGKEIAQEHFKQTILKLFFY
jgi:hypothetical protein